MNSLYERIRLRNAILRYLSGKQPRNSRVMYKDLEERGFDKTKVMEATKATLESGLIECVSGTTSLQLIATDDGLAMLEFDEAHPIDEA